MFTKKKELHALQYAITQTLVLLDLHLYKQLGWQLPQEFDYTTENVEFTPALRGNLTKIRVKVTIHPLDWDDDASIVFFFDKIFIARKKGYRYELCSGVIRAPQIPGFEEIEFIATSLTLGPWRQLHSTSMRGGNIINQRSSELAKGLGLIQ